MWPIVTNSIRIAEMALNTQFLVRTVVIFAPVLRLTQHQLLHHGAQRLPLSNKLELGGDVFEAIERLAQGEGYPGSALEDGESGFDQARERLWRLIIRGMRLKHELWKSFKRSAEPFRPFRIINDDVFIAEFHAGLHDDADRPIKAGVEPEFPKGFAVGVDRGDRSVGVCDFEVIESLHCSARDRDLCPDDVNWP